MSTSELEKIWSTNNNIHTVFVYMKIRRGGYRPPHAGVLANNLLKK
jgi:hypothetical protein